MTRDEATKSFDESAAIAELERLLHAIQTARHDRQVKVDEFQAFVQSFRRPGSETAADPAVTARALPPPGAPAPAAAAPPLPLDFHEADAPVLDKPPRARPTFLSRLFYARALVLAGAVAVVIALGAITLLLRRSPAESTSQPPGPATPVASAPTTPEAATPSPAPAPAARPVEVELKTVRPVWMRVVVDDRKEIERLVPGGERLRFGADRSIVVRAGNGAAVLVTSGDHESPLGVEGQPITRTFAPRD